MTRKNRNFELYFRSLSYLAALSGVFALYFAGGIGIAIFFGFIGLMAAAWFLEDSNWQVTERIGVGILIIFVPLIALEWRYQFLGTGLGESFTATGLSRLILFLCAIKLLQKKSDRDWVFIYIISFFEIFLAAGLTISPLFIFTLLGYLLFSISGIIAFEIRKTSRNVLTQRLVTADESVSTEKPFLTNIYLPRLPLVAAGLLFFISLLAIPTFFALPRVGGAGLGSSLSNLGGSITGFSDSVSLGDIGRLKQSNETVMRVRVERSNSAALPKIYWRGIALDTFDNKRWTKSRASRFEKVIKSSNGFFPVNFARKTSGNIVQTFYLESIGTPILFALPKPISVRGYFDLLRKDPDDSLRANNSGFERISYIVRSDPFVPEVEKLKSDNSRYSPAWRRYLNLPRGMDRRIRRLAARVVARSGARNRYEKARAIERFFHNNYGYSLDMRAGGDQPLADFLFNIREGHCEYFSTAMAIMLRTQGIATRVVNGFQQGEFNETAGVYVVKQKDAHSWVEVYFPETNSWVTFDPTPSEGQFAENSTKGIVGSFNDYLEALEAFWIQYFVSYDSQGQRTLFQSAQNRFAKVKDVGSSWFQTVQRRLELWWEQVRGDKGLQASLIAIAFGLGYAVAAGLAVALLIWLFRRIQTLGFWGSLRKWLKHKNEATIIEFYERMQKILAGKGLSRSPFQTPLEFAGEINIPEAVKVTEKYNRVRFGKKDLSHEEAKEIENWLEKLEKE